MAAQQLPMQARTGRVNQRKFVLPSTSRPLGTLQIFLSLSVLRWPWYRGSFSSQVTAPKANG